MTLMARDKRKDLVDLLKRCQSILGEVWECGVFRGGSAAIMSRHTKKVMRLFDSWEGLPEPTKEDNAHKKGHFSNVDFNAVRARFKGLPNVHLHKGWIPEVFEGLEKSRISFAHVDLDLYLPYLRTMEFIYPRLSEGGIMVFNDYGVPSCKGATQAVDEFFEGKEEISARGRTRYILKKPS